MIRRGDCAVENDGVVLLADIEQYTVCVVLCPIEEHKNMFCVKTSSIASINFALKQNFASVKNPIRVKD